MIFKNKYRLMAIFFATSLLYFSQNCAKANFSQANSSSAVGDLGTPYVNVDQPHTDSNSCYTYLHQTTTPIRLLFVVDQSGSNAGAQGTDPNQQVRAGSIQAFYDDYASKSGFAWGLIGFAQWRAIPYVKDATSPIFAGPSVMADAISVFRTTADSGNTPYAQALEAAALTISQDVNAPADTKYIVVFLSDGIPNPVVSDADLTAWVQHLVDTHPNRVSLNTVYYGPANPDASTRLAKMAETGHGFFLDTNLNPSGNSFLISNIVNVPGVTCTP